MTLNGLEYSEQVIWTTFMIVFILFISPSLLWTDVIWRRQVGIRMQIIQFGNGKWVRKENF